MNVDSTNGGGAGNASFPPSPITGRDIFIIRDTFRDLVRRDGYIEFYRVFVCVDRVFFFLGVRPLVKAA